MVSKINIQNGKSQLISNVEGNNAANTGKKTTIISLKPLLASKPYTFVLKDGNGKAIERTNEALLTSKLQSDNFSVKEFIDSNNRRPNECVA